ncbi:MAG: 23S rRNA (guanosine(2251)-2'-O)-methyltransferase RlmB [Proteobacteria bacterium]|nr:23S rRNA (guanosine(2251)-2'-O)-methyltransferase RlmB [Pseudomonadota bacterium]
MSLWIYGINPVSAVIDNRPKDIKEIVFIKTRDEKKEGDRLASIRQNAQKYRIRISEQTEEEAFEKIKFRPGANHQRVFAFINPIQTPSLMDVLNSDKDKKGRIFFMLDGITDIHNLGAIIRTAVAFNVEAIIVPKDRNASITSDVYKTSSGAVEYIKVSEELNLVRAVGILKENNFWIYGFEADGTQDIRKADLKGNVCCVIGGEDSGIRRLLRDNCDMILRIPISSKAHSLNASVSAAVVMYEVLRQSFPN